MSYFVRKFKIRYQSAGTLLDELQLPQGVNASACGICHAPGVREIPVDIIGEDAAALAQVFNRLNARGVVVPGEPCPHERPHFNQRGSVKEFAQRVE